jgi:hypothetical protein
MTEASKTEVGLDLHGYHPDDICGEPLNSILHQAFEMGADRIKLIHGHGHNRGLSVGFVNTNTGFFGLRIRDQLRHNVNLRQWIKHTTLDCGHEGATTIKLKRNKSPTREKFDNLPEPGALPERTGELMPRGRLSREVP